MKLFSFKKSEADIIQEIHNEFDTAPDRLLQEALNILQSTEDSKIELESDIVDKASRLEKLGFTRNKAVTKKTEIEAYNKQKDSIIKLTVKEAEGIKYYSNKYPFMKFLTEKELDRICDKYGLIYAPVDYYTETVPDKNLSEIENHQIIDKQDEMGNSVTWEFVNDNPYYSETFNKIIKLLGKNTFTEKEIEDVYLKYLDKNLSIYSKVSYSGVKDLTYYDYECLNLFYALSNNKIICDKIIICDGIKHTEEREGYFIAAPKEHFDLKDLTANPNNKGFYKRTSVVKKDPIVFKYVKGGVLIISKWGLEANDEALQVGILN